MKRLIILGVLTGLTLGLSSACQRETLPPLPDTSKQALKDWLPKYPNVSKDSSDQKTVQFTTPDTAADVARFYEEKLKATGFSVDPKPESGPFMPFGIATVEFRPMAAERKAINKHVKIDLAITERDPVAVGAQERTLVMAVWKDAGQQ